VRDEVASFDTNRANRVTQIAFADGVSVHVVAGCA